MYCGSESDSIRIKFNALSAVAATEVSPGDSRCSNSKTSQKTASSFQSQLHDCVPQALMHLDLTRFISFTACYRPKTHGFQ